MSQSKLKSQLRQRLRQQRNALTQQQVESNARIIVEKIITSAYWQQSQHVGIYLPIKNEVDLTALLHTEKTCYIPSVRGSAMQFHRYHQQLPLITTAYGLSQPKFASCHKQPQLDLCLMPLVGFDTQGHRLGMGGGYYDRYFENNSDTVLLGVAHAVQKHEQLPTDPWDVKLQGIITEQDWFLI